MGIPLSTCYDKRKSTEQNFITYTSEINNPLNLRTTNKLNKEKEKE